MTGRLCPMSTASDDSAGAGPRAPVVPQRRHTGRLVAVIITVLAVILVVVGTKVVPDEEIAAETADFDKETFGAENFPDIQAGIVKRAVDRSEEHTSELQSRGHLVCRLLLEENNTNFNAGGWLGNRVVHSDALHVVQRY